MKCPFCFHADTQVMDSRVGDDGDTVRRRRRCTGCEKRFTTYERTELRFPYVIKRNGTREEFDPQKLSASFWLALRKRQVPTEEVDRAISKVQEQLITTGEREIEANLIGEMVMCQLQQLDTVAWIRFASVYRNFEDTASFLQAIKEAETSQSN